MSLGTKVPWAWTQDREAKIDMSNHSNISREVLTVQQGTRAREKYTGINYTSAPSTRRYGAAISTTPPSTRPVTPTNSATRRRSEGRVRHRRVSPGRWAAGVARCPGYPDFGSRGGERCPTLPRAPRGVRRWPANQPIPAVERHLSAVCRRWLLVLAPGNRALLRCGHIEDREVQAPKPATNLEPVRLLQEGGGEAPEVARVALNPKRPGRL